MAATVVPVPYSQLKDYSYYIVPKPSDEARFLTATFARNAAEYLMTHHRLLLKYAGKKMHVLVKRYGAWNTHLHDSDSGKIESVYFDETSFPDGQLFQEVKSDWKPNVPAQPAAQSTDQWDEFNEDNNANDDNYNDDDDDHDAHVDMNEVKLTDVLTEGDIAAQEQFYSSLSPVEHKALSKYKEDGYSFMEPLMSGMPEHALGVVPYAREETRAFSARSGRPPGFIREFMAGFLSFISNAPRLTKEINVFRGVVGKEGLNIDGKMPMSTSYDKHVAFSFSNGKGACCMLKINVKPGVKIFVWGQSDDEKEIMVLPPYNAQIENIGELDSGLKKVTITPAKYRGGRRKTRKHKRRARKTRRRHK
jgi:hypothetical protein